MCVEGGSKTQTFATLITLRGQSFGSRLSARSSDLNKLKAQGLHSINGFRCGDIILKSIIEHFPPSVFLSFDSNHTSVHPRMGHTLVKLQSKYGQSLITGVPLCDRLVLRKIQNTSASVRLVFTTRPFLIRLRFTGKWHCVSVHLLLPVHRCVRAGIS